MDGWRIIVRFFDENVMKLIEWKLKQTIKRIFQSTDNICFAPAGLYNIYIYIYIRRLSIYMTIAIRIVGRRMSTPSRREAFATFTLYYRIILHASTVISTTTQKFNEINSKYF